MLLGKNIDAAGVHGILYVRDDPVHGSWIRLVCLKETEVLIIGCQAFQQLRGTAGRGALALHKGRTETVMIRPGGGKILIEKGVF